MKTPTHTQALSTETRRINFMRLMLFAVAALLTMRAAHAQDYNQPGYATPQEADPPSRVARVSLLNGDVSFEPAGTDQFSAAEVNYPLTTGDRLYSNDGALSELEAGGLAVRLGQQTDFTVTALTDTLAQFGLAQGSIHVRSFSLDPGSVTEIDTPIAAISVQAVGDVRIDASPDGTTTIVTLLSGSAEVTADGIDQPLEPGQSFRVRGSGPSYADYVRRARADALDSFSADRDAAYAQAVAADDQYVNPDTIGAADLAQAGDWSADADNGPVWYPRGVAVDWAPYRVGHWAYVAPWGWTWVEAEPWGFTPFHYGRWIRVGHRWGWIPGPPVVRPVYSPALVVFIGGGGAGFTGWFPLGPRETFVPWYHTSAVYVNRVNVTNIYNRNTVEVRNVYNNRTTNVYVNNTTIKNVTYINRGATIAVPQNSFGNGQPVLGKQIHGNPQQFAEAPVQTRPPVAAAPPARALPPARVQPPVAPRPVLATHTPSGFHPAPMGSTGPARPVQPVGSAHPGEPVSPTTPANATQPGGSKPFTGPVGPTRPSPVRPGMEQPVQPASTPTPTPAPTPGPTRPSPIRPGMEQPVQPAPVERPQPAAQPQPSARPQPGFAPEQERPQPKSGLAPVLSPAPKAMPPAVAPAPSPAAPAPAPKPAPQVFREQPAPRPQPEQQRPQPEQQRPQPAPPQKPQPQPKPAPAAKPAPSPKPSKPAPAKDDDKKHENR